jgi:hypothetical protein
MKKKSKKTFELILIIILIVLASVATFLVYKKLTLHGQEIGALHKATVTTAQDLSTYGWQCCCNVGDGLCCWEYFSCSDNSCDC